MDGWTATFPIVNFMLRLLMTVVGRVDLLWKFWNTNTVSDFNSLNSCLLNLFPLMPFVLFYDLKS